MSNPPGWVYRTKHTDVVGKNDVGSVIGGAQIMAGVQAGVVGAAAINSQPSKMGAISQPATWATIWFIVATLYLLGVYYGALKLHGKG